MASKEQMKQLCDQLAFQINESLTLDPIITSEEENFIDYYINSAFLMPIYSTVTTPETYRQLTEILTQKISTLLKNIPMTEDKARFASIYLQVIMKCTENVKNVDESEIFDTTFLENVISFAPPALKHANPTIIRKTYTKFAQMIGSNSEKIFQIFQIQIKTMIQKKPTPKEFKYQMVPFSRFIANKSSVSCALDVLVNLFDEIYSSYKREICGIISQFIMQSFRITPQDFKSSSINIPAANEMLKKMCPSKTSIESYKWEVITSLVLLQHQLIDNNAFDFVFTAINKALMKKTTDFDPDKEYALISALYTTLAVAETSGIDSYVTLFNRFKPALLDIAKNNINMITSVYECVKCFIFGDLPIALFFTDIEEFTNIMSIYCADNIGVPRDITARVIQRCSVRINSEEKRKIINLIVVNIVEASSFDKQASDSLPLVYQAFEKDPEILLHILNFNPGLLSLMCKPCSKIGQISFSKAFISSMYLMKDKEKQLEVIENTVSGLINNAEQYMLMKGDALLTISPVLEFIINFSSNYFEVNNEGIQPPRIAVFAMQLEGIALCFLPTPLSPISLKILEFVINIVTKFNVIEIAQIPIQNYKTFLEICKEDGKFNSSNPNVFKPLKEIPIENYTITKNFCKHIAALAHGLDPVAVNETISSVSNVQSPALMRSEFTDSLLLYCSLSKKPTPMFFNIIGAALQSGGFLGMTTAQLLPTVISKCNFIPLSKFIYNWMREIGQSFTDSNTNFTANVMKLYQILMATEEWTTSSISIPLAEKMALSFTAYINMLVSEQRLAQCSEFLIVFMSKYKSLISQQSRMEIATTIASWLARIDCKKSTEKAGALLCTALAKAVDGIPFSHEVYDDLMFITTALNTKLDKQPALHKEISKAISAVFKSNFALFSKSELARSLIGSGFSRAAYVLAAEEALTNSTAVRQNNIIDCLFANDFAVLVEIISIIPHKQCEGFGSELAKAAISRHLESEFIEKMTELEILEVNELTKNKIFRGNGVTSRAVMAYTRIFGADWIMTIYNPLVESARKHIENGESMNIKTDRLEAGEDIEANRVVFRMFFIEAINIITAAIPKLPIQIIKMLQIVFHKVTEKYGELGTMILNGILLLRFIIPILTAPAPQKVVVSEEVRQCMVGLSIALMAASLRGELTDKGPDYIMFNDVAALALDRFSASVNHITAMDITGAAAKWIEIDEVEVSEKCSTILAQNTKQLNAKFEEIKQTRELNENEKQVSEFVSKYVPPPIIPRELRNPEQVFSHSSKELKEIVNVKPTANEKMLLDEWFFVDSPNGANFDTFYLIAKNQPKVVDERVLISHVLNTIAIAPKDYYIIADFADYDIDMIPKTMQFKKLLHIIPAQIKASMKEVYVLRSTRQFVEFYNEIKTPLLLDRITFIKTKDDISQDIIMSDRLPEESKETLLDEGSLQNTIINGNKVVIRVSRHSIQMSSTINGTIVNDVVMLKNIKNVSELTAPDETLAFTITTKDDKKYVFTTFTASGLYHLVVSAFERANREEIKYPQICTDSSDADSSKWLLLLISLIGLSNKDCPYHQETSYKLLQTVVQKYQFQINVPQSVEEASEKCYEMMKDAAEFKPEDAGHFIVEVEKVMNLVKEPLIAFKLLQPWAPIIAKGYGGYPTLRYLIELSSNDEECMNIIKEGIWPALMDPSCIRKSLEVFFPVASVDTTCLLLKFANADKKLTSEVAISELLKRRQNASMNIFILVNNSCFDFESFGPHLIHAAVLMRIATTSNDLLADLTTKEIKLVNNEANTNDLKEALLSQEDETAGNAISQAIGDNEEFRSALINLFKEDFGKEKEFYKISSPETIVKCIERN